MKNQSKKSKTVTQQRISAPKGLQLICALVALVLDLAVLWIIVDRVSEFEFLICPILLAVLDLCFVFKVLFSNYRFTYAFGGVITHFVCIAIVCAYTTVTTGFLNERTVFVDFALYAMPAVHLLQCFAAFFNAIHLMNHKKFFRRILALTLTVVFLVSVGVYGKYLMTNGFFGQGNDRTQRTVTYELNESDNTYVVTGVLEGKGNAVTIPETFNGLPVSGIDCRLFANKGLKYVTLNCSETVEFLNVAELNQVDDALRIETAKNKLDTFRNELYSLALTNGLFLGMANNVYPSDLANNEVYVMFTYTDDLLTLANGSILPTWFGSKGDKFDIYQHAASVPYVDNSDAKNGNDLYWCYVNQDRKIFRAVVTDERVSMNNAEISESVKLSLDFENIYQLVFQEDNDQKYDIAKEYTTFTTESNRVLEYRLATAANIAEIIESVPQRDGFSLAWFIGSDKREIKDMKADIATQVTALNNAGKHTLELHPVWDLNAPTIDYITVDGVTTDHSAVYGSNVVLDSKATPPHKSISVKYQWKFNTELSDTNKYTLTNIHPQDAGTYTLLVTAYSDVTSLTKTVEATIDVGFQKKDLNFSWQIPSGADLVYSATDKPITVQYDATDVINGDTIESQLTRNSVRDAGDYTIMVTLVGDAATKYQVPLVDLSREFTIEPYSLGVTWGNEISFVYNGNNQAPQAAAIGLGNDGAISIKVTERKDVGEWTAIATTTNTNYVLTDYTRNCEITRRPITAIIWKDTTSFEYNGSLQSAEISNLENLVPSEKTEILASIIYEGRETDVGTGYTVKAVLPEDSNYVFNCTEYQQYSIYPKQLEITIADKTFVYSGTYFTDFTFTHGNIAPTDKIEEILSLSYTGSAVSAINVNTNGYTIDASEIPASKYHNYSVTVVPGKLTITPKALTVKLENATKTYDGLIYPIDSYTFTVTGLVETYDTIDEVLTLEYIGDAVSAVDYRNTAYELDATPIAGLKYDNYTVTVLKASLKINKRPITVTAIGSNKVYDGTAFNANDFDYRFSESLVNDEPIENFGTPEYSGAALMNKNVGTYQVTLSFASNSINSNYAITVEPGQCQITPKPLTITAVGSSKVYDGSAGNNSNFSFTHDGGLVDSLSSLGSPIYSGDAKTNKNVGVHTLKVSFNANTTVKNYDITYVDGEFEITPKQVTITLRGGSKVYDGLISTTQDFESLFTINGLVSGDSKQSFGTPVYTGSATENSDAGEYSLQMVSIPGNSNYEITSYGSVASYSIMKRSLTVTPTATNRVYDGTVGGSFDFTVSGLVNGDSKEMLGTPTYGGTAVQAKDAGTYTLNVTGFDANGLTKNYTVNSTWGSFVISKKELTVQVNAQNRVYGDTSAKNFSFTVLDGLVAGDTAQALGTPIYSNDAMQAQNAGSYRATVSFAENSVNRNYNISCVGGEFEIVKRELTVQINAQNRVYGDTSAKNFSFTVVNGLAMGHTAQDLGTPIYNNEALQAKDVGSYQASVSFAENSVNRNYNITCIGGQFEITKKNLTVTAIAQDRVYENGVVGGSFSYSLDGLAEGDAQFLGEASYSGTAVSATEAGTYVLSVRLDGFTRAGNYNITYVDDTNFVISPAPAEEN